MKCNIIGGLAVFALLIAAPLSAANAADMAVKAPPLAPPPAYNWTGFYLGAEGGGGWGHAEHTDVTGFDSGPFALSGGLIGGTIGYNWQINKIVLGLEGDGSGAWIKGSTMGTPPLNLCGGAPSSCQSALQALGTFRARAGIAIDRFLPYVTGGLAVGALHGHEGDILANGAVGDGTVTVAGWTVGGGIEAAISPNWSAKVEYLHVDLGNHSIFNDVIPSLGGAIFAENVRFTTEIFRVGLNYKFNWGGPLVAAY
jgi:outer membrane immunogenic protein